MQRVASKWAGADNSILYDIILMCASRPPACKALTCKGRTREGGGIPGQEGILAANPALVQMTPHVHVVLGGQVTVLQLEGFQLIKTIVGNRAGRWCHVLEPYGHLEAFGVNLQITIRFEISGVMPSAISLKLGGPGPLF